VANDDSRDRDCDLCERIVPTDPNVPYDMSMVVKEVREEAAEGLQRAAGA
jgi:acetyl-CoA carboxylase carboxyltransferase component